MVLLDEVKRSLSELQPEVADLADALAIERSRLRLEELENKSADPAFYDDAANSGKVFAEMGEIKERLENYRQLQELCSDAETLLEMCAEDETDEAIRGPIPARESLMWMPFSPAWTAASRRTASYPTI